MSAGDYRETSPTRFLALLSVGNSREYGAEEKHGMGTKAIAYIRVSTQEQAVEGVSLDAQRQKVEAYAAFRELDLVEVVVDAGVSASKPLAARPGGARLVNAVAGGEVGAVVAVKLDRLFRNAADCLVVTRDWDDAKVALHLLDLGIETRSPMGRAFLTMAAAFGELELNLIRERTRTGLAQVKAEGGRLGREAFGWRRLATVDADGRRVCEPAPDEVAALERALTLRREGATYQAIADTLNAEGTPTKHRTIWRPGTVRAVLLRTT